MSTSIAELPKKESLFQSIEEELVPALKTIENKFHLAVTWKILAPKILDEKEINRVIARIADFYLGLQEKKELKLCYFNFELDVNRETSQFNLRVRLVSDFFIHTSALKPTGLDLNGCLDEEGLAVEGIEQSVSPQNTGGTGLGPRIPVNTEMASISLAYNSIPPQNTGGTGPGTI